MAHFPAGLTATEIDNIYDLAVGMFRAAPGATHAHDLSIVVEAGLTFPQIAQALAETVTFQNQSIAYSTNPPSQNPQQNAAFTAEFLNNLLDPGIDPVGRAFAESFVLDRLNHGQSRGTTMWDALVALDAANADPVFGSSATLFDNRKEVAEHFTEVLGVTSTNIIVLQAALDGVTTDPASVEDAKESNANSLDSLGQTFTLTDQPDTVPGLVGSDGTTNTDGNDLIVGLQDTGDDTFGPGDDVNGGFGTNTLRISSTGDTTNEIDLSVADISNVDKVDLRINDVDFDHVELGSIGDGLASLSMEFGNGEQTNDVNVDNFDVNTAVTISNIESDNSDISINFNSLDDGSEDPINGSMTLRNIDSTYVYVDFDNDDDGTNEDSDTYTLTLDNVSDTDDNAGFEIDSVETLNVIVESDSELDYLAASYYNNDGVQDAVTVNLTLNGALELGQEGNDNSLDFSDATGSEVTFNVTGSGDLTVWGLDDVGSDLTVNAGDATGNINFDQTSDELASLTVEFGPGDDRLDLQSGFSLADLVADGGAGENILGLDADDVDDIADADLNNFQTLELSGAASGDVTLNADDNGFDNVILSADIGDDLTIEDLSGDLTISADQAGTVTVTPVPASDDLAVLFNEGSATDIEELDVSDYTAVDVTLASADDDVTFTKLTVGSVDTLSFTGEGDVEINDLSSTTGLDDLDLSGLTGVFDNEGATLSNNADVLIGNLGDDSFIDLDTGVGQVLTFGAVFDTDTLTFGGFDAGVTDDVLDFAALGVDEFLALEINDDGGPDTTITADEFDGVIILLGVVEGDLTSANFAFA